MSKILELAKEIDEEFQEQDKQIKNLTNRTNVIDKQLYDQGEEIRILRDHADYLVNELSIEKARNSEFRKDLMQLLSKYSSDEWIGW